MFKKEVDDGPEGKSTWIENRYNKDWDTKWYANDKNFSDFWLKTIKSGNYKEEAVYAGISRIEIERAANKIKINVHTAKPGLGNRKRRTGIEELRKEVEKLTGKSVSLLILRK
jgi:small subunit ribosomal protein S3